MNTSYNYSMRKHFMIVLLMGLLMVVILSLTYFFFQIKCFDEGYLLIHNILELFSVIGASLIFVTGWNAYNFSSSKSINLLSIIFFSIAIFDLSHLLSYSGMPNYITPGSSEKAISFWLAGRSIAAFGFFIFGIAFLLPIKNYFNRYILFSFMLTLTLLAHWIFLFHPNILPHTFIEGQGLTNFKIYTEYVIIGFNILTLIILYIRMKKSQPPYIPALFTAISIMAMSEFFFTLYNDITDIYLLFGHIYKVVSYVYMYQVLFVVTVKQPYEELDKSQLELLDKNTLLDTIIDNIPNMIFLKDAKDLKFIRLNLAGEKLLGHISDDFIGKNDYDFFPKDEADFFAKHDRKVFKVKSGIDIAEENIKTPLGIRILHTKKVPIFDKDGKPKYLLGISEDITDKKENEKKLQDQEEIMIAQSQHVAMGEMIGMIAHQWRQPLTIISMGANNIIVDVDLEEVDTADFKKEAQDILHQTEHLSKTIDDFKNFFRPNKEKEMVRVEDIVFEAQAIIGKSIENNNIILSIEHDISTPISIYSREFLQVIINILNNSKEALVERKIDNSFINVKVKDNLDFIVTTICDNGGGIKEQVIKKIFEPYFSTKKKLTGTGLGLYISKTIVEKHLHGTISVRNIDNGVCFEISLPKQYEE